MTEQIKVFAPASVGNVGPGFDMLGVAIEGLGDVVSMQKTSHATTITSISGVDADLITTDPSRNVVALAADHFIRQAGLSFGVSIAIERSLPVSGGLGSSAAAAVAGALAAAHLAGLSDKTEAILLSALHGEACVAGCHLDNIAPCYFGGLTAIQSLEPMRIVKIPVSSGWWFTLFTPDTKLDTKKSRAILPPSVPQQLFVQQMANTVSVVSALMQGDSGLLHHAMHDLYAAPHRSKLIPDYELIHDAALKSGAACCAISGSGPSLFAVSTNATTAAGVADAMKKAYKRGDSKTHVGTIAKEGARVL
jgi:homoserine kinase